MYREMYGSAFFWSCAYCIHHTPCPVGLTLYSSLWLSPQLVNPLTSSLFLRGVAATLFHAPTILQVEIRWGPPVASSVALASQGPAFIAEGTSDVLPASLCGS